MCSLGMGMWERVQPTVRRTETAEIIKSMCIKISAVDTTWSWLGRCELNDNLVEKTNLCRDKRGIKFLSVSVILCFMVLTHSFPMQDAR